MYSIDHPLTFPDSLEYLTLPKELPRNIEKGFFPPNLKVIHFNNYDFDDSFEIGIFPNTVEEIHFHSGYPFLLEEGTLPSNLIKLTIDMDPRLFELLPNSIQELNISSINRRGEWCNDFSAKELPKSLTKLTLGENQPIHELEHLPPNIKYLKLGNYFKGRIPNTLESIEFHSKISISTDYLFQ